MVSSFSAIHHLKNEKKELLFRQIHDVLRPKGWFFFIDAMSIHFDDEVFLLGRFGHSWTLPGMLAAKCNDAAP